MAQDTCSDAECENPVKARGMCSKHYQRWVAAGGQVDRRPNYGSGIRRAPNGYTYVWRPDHPLAHRDGYVAQHRMVAWDVGILTDPEMHVHHIDHDKGNNDPSNLEVMSEGDHHRHHVHAEGGVENQYGYWGLNAEVCSVSGCGRPTKNRDLCAAHYSRLIRWGGVRADVPVGSGRRPAR